MTKEQFVKEVETLSEKIRQTNLNAKTVSDMLSILKESVAEKDEAMFQMLNLVGDKLSDIISSSLIELDTDIRKLSKEVVSLEVKATRQRKNNDNTEDKPKQKRKRRTKAEIEADKKFAKILEPENEPEDKKEEQSN